MTDLLTAEELAAVDLAARLAESLARVVGDGPTRNADLNELLVHVHAIQQAVMSQAAARAYPESFRLLGGVVKATRPACCRCFAGDCETDETGDHCMTRACAYCLDGCPATDRPCCKEATGA